MARTFRPSANNWHDKGSWSDAFAEAEAYLAGGRAKTSRRINPNTMMRRIDDDTIAIVFHDTAIVTYKRDGRFILFMDGWNTITTKKRMYDFSPIRGGLYTTKTGRLIVGTDETDRTPARVQKCRSCMGAGRLKYGECYRCNGAGRFDYGSNPKPITIDPHDAWIVDVTGTYVGTADDVPVSGGSATTAGYKPYYSSSPWSAGYMPPSKPQKPAVFGSEVTHKLARVLPGLSTEVKHPVTGETGEISTWIISLNDRYRWSRERIADWLDTLDADLRFPA